MADEIRPIRTAADYDAALAELKRLWDAPEGTPESDRCEVLATLIDSYEAEHYPVDLPDPIEAIKFRMEQQGMTPKDLEPLIGSHTGVAEVLSRQRELTVEMIRRLHAALGIPVEILIQPIGQSAKVLDHSEAAASSATS